MGEAFCCMICRLLQPRAPACLECGAMTMVGLASGADVLQYRTLDVAVPTSSPKNDLKLIGGTLAGVAAYVGIVAGAVLWWPAIPLVLGGGSAIAGAVAWRHRKLPIADLPLLPVALAPGAVEKRGIARKLSDTVKALDGSHVLVEQAVLRRRRGDVLLRKTTSVRFQLDVEGARVVVDGTVRVASPGTRVTVKRGDRRLAALGIPPELAAAGELETATVCDGDRVLVTGLLAVDVVPELAFHRDAGEAEVMRGAPGRVVAIVNERGKTCS